ncbi:MAG: type II toxin-antitoxin system RelE/ParE family toxin [Allosphingosinicella sp.]
MKVNLTGRAQKDLDEIVAWIGADHPKRAVSFAQELWGRCQSLASRPERFPVSRSISGRRIRKLSYRGYLIFYFVMEGHVEIARIVQGSRNWVALLDEG